MLPNTLRKAFDARMIREFGLRPPPKIGLSVSGGVDSMALASLAAEWARPRDIALHAFVVNHNLRRNSGSEAAAVAQSLQSHFGLSSSVLDLRLGDPARVEEVARTGRRSALETACNDHAISDLLLGHHLNDQVELFVHRLLSGSSWFGLAGMAARTPLNPRVEPGAPPPVTLVRPLLEFEKADLQAWCTHHGIAWWEDPTNHDVHLTRRNLIRRMYSLGLEPPALAVPEVRALMARFAEQRARAQELAQRVLEQLRTAGRLVYTPGAATLTVGADVRALAPAVRLELLFRIIAPVSPFDTEHLFTRRHRLRALADELGDYSGELLPRTALGVLVRREEERWTLSREVPRRAQQLAIEVHRATRAWSAWTLVDQRWWLRWRLPAAAKTDTMFFNVRLLADPEPVLQVMERAMPADVVAGVRKAAPSHPFLMLSEASNPDAFEPTKLIGFPTLGVVHGLEVEVEPTSYQFS